MKAEQNKQPATPLLGRKVFPDTTDFSSRPSPLVQQPAHEKTETRLEQKDSLSVPNGVQLESHRTRAERGEARVGYVRQEMKPERLQPKIDHVEAKITEKILPAQEGTRGERAEIKVAQGMATLTVDKAEGKSSRHADRRRERHDRRVERQESSEQEVPKPEHLEERRRRDRHDKRLERQGSSEQEPPKQEQTERRRDRHERRAEKPESSEQETPKIEPDKQVG